jgi:Protein of unknown function (DUF3501)
MRRARREELLDLAAYERSRAEIRAGVLEAKGRRRIHVAGVLTFLFENAATVRYQVQEMIRAERITREADVLRELETYNELLGGRGELGCSLLIEIPDPAERDEKLRAWLGLPHRLYVKLEDGAKVRPTFDARQVGEHRLSSVQYLKFDVRGRTPVAVGCDHPALEGETMLDAEQRAALAADLASDPAS